MATIAAPAGLAQHGIAFWGEVTSKYELRVDELSTLEDACREVDIIQQLESYRLADGFEMFVRGSQGQQVINPVMSELRQHVSVKKALLAQLKLPDDNSTDQGGELSAKNRAAANARWARRGA